MWSLFIAPVLKAAQAVSKQASVFGSILTSSTTPGADRIVIEIQMDFR